MFLTFVEAHWGVVLAVSAYVALAFLNQVPKPGEWKGWYEYLFNVKSALLNNVIVQTFEQKYQVPGAPKS